MAKIVLINPSWRQAYNNVLYSVATAFFPPLNLAMIGGQLIKEGHKVDILDISYKDFVPDSVLSDVKSLNPDIVGFTSTTSLFSQVVQLSKLIKKMSRGILTVGGGSHCSALPVESLTEANLDIIVTGEGELSFSQIACGAPLKNVPGIVYRDKSGQIQRNAPGEWIKDLDSLPMPAWCLFDLKNYEHLTSRLMLQKPLGAYFETSRGCIYQCNFCANVPTQGPFLRKKTVARVIEEMKYMKSFGFNEFSITDNLFTTDVARTKEICRAMVDNKLDLAWQCHNGIRVDAGDQEMFNLMKAAGCYRVAFGFESGNEDILKNTGKGGSASLSRASEAVSAARKAGIEVLGYFMLGLLDDTEKTMRETIEFGKKLPLDLLKISYCIPFPGTPFFNMLRSENAIDTNNWEAFNVYHPQDFFKHPTLACETVIKYYKMGYRKMMYANPAFIFRRLIHTIRKGTFFDELGYFLKFLFAGAKI